MKRRVLNYSVILLSLFGCNHSNQNANSKRDEMVTNTINQLVKENQLPGLNFSIVFEDGKQENFSSGYADLESKAKLSSDHFLFSGSIGKSYAVAVLMQLIDEGRIKLKNKLIDYFPETEWLNNLPNIQEITVEMLLQHTSGLPEYVQKPKIWETVKANPDKVWSYQERLAMIFNDQPIHEAGQAWSYSDTNYILAGMLIEKVTGNDYYDEVKARILNPKKLKATYAANKRRIDHLATGYTRHPEIFPFPEKVVVKGEYVFNPQLEWTGGGFVSTTSDLARWAKIYYEGGLFSDSLLTKIVTPLPYETGIESMPQYGMGSFILKTKYGKAFGHTGIAPGFRAIFAYYPELKIAVALQSNCDNATANLPFTDYLDRILLNYIEVKQEAMN